MSHPSNVDVSDSLTPEQNLWAVIAMAHEGAYRGYVPRWWWDLYGRRIDVEAIRSSFDEYRRVSLSPPGP